MFSEIRAVSTVFALCATFQCAQAFHHFFNQNKMAAINDLVLIAMHWLMVKHLKQVIETTNDLLDELKKKNNQPL